MAHVIPTLRTSSRASYTPTSVRRQPGIPASAGNSASGADFGTVLKKQTTSAATASASPSTAAAAVNPWTAIAAATPTVVATPTTIVASPMAPTAQSLFGANPWCSNAGGTGPNGSYNYNQYYFATPETAAKVAQILGGKVVTADALTPNGPFKQNQPNQMILMPDGRLVNAGLVAAFYDHGYGQQTVDQLIAGEITGVGLYT